jgi:hypothetical protein
LWRETSMRSYHQKTQTTIISEKREQRGNCIHCSNNTNSQTWLLPLTNTPTPGTDGTVTNPQGSTWFFPAFQWTTSAFNHLHYLQPSFCQCHLRTGSPQSRTNHERSHPRIRWISHTSLRHHSTTSGKIRQQTTAANRWQPAWQWSREQLQTCGWKPSCPRHPQRSNHPTRLQLDRKGATRHTQQNL